MSAACRPTRAPSRHRHRISATTRGLTRLSDSRRRSSFPRCRREKYCCRGSRDERLPAGARGWRGVRKARTSGRQRRTVSAIFALCAAFSNALHVTTQHGPAAALSTADRRSEPPPGTRTPRVRPDNPPRTVGSTALTCVALAAFVVVDQPEGGTPTPTARAQAGALAAFGGAAVVMTLAARVGSPMRRAALYTAAAESTLGMLRPAVIDERRQGRHSAIRYWLAGTRLDLGPQIDRRTPKTGLGKPTLTVSPMCRLLLDKF